MRDKRKQILYLGLDPTRFLEEGEITHLPLIKAAPRPFPEVSSYFASIPKATHLLFTSRVAVSYFASYAKQARLSWGMLKRKTYFSVGEATNQALLEEKLPSSTIAPEPCGEGVISLLERYDLSKATLFYPHSAQARPLIKEYLVKKAISHLAFPLYDTVSRKVTLPDLALFDEILFTSPSTVAAFASLSSHPPPSHKCRPIGPITASALTSYLQTQNLMN